MQSTNYHKNIVDYYDASENAYKDAWDLNNSLAIHYGYWDKNVKSFPQSLQRMNEVMAEAGRLKTGDVVLDAGCGVGGSSIFLASKIGCKVVGVSLSEKQIQQARQNAVSKNVSESVAFKAMDYCNTGFPNESFDAVWGCESICYADNKEEFIKEAFRLLKRGGKLIVADGFVIKYENNNEPVIRKWLDGWQVNYLETMKRFCDFMQRSGFNNIRFTDISTFTNNSSRRLYRFYFLASLYLWWKKLTSRRRFSDMQKKNIQACKYQFVGMKKKLWQYGLIVGEKPK